MSADKFMTEPTNPALTVEQEEFEKWAESTAHDLPLTRYGDGKRYADSRTDNCRQAWQASRRHTLGEVIRKLSKEVDRLRGLKSGVRDYQHSDQADILEQFAEKLEAELKAKTGQCAATIVSGLR